MSATTTQAPEQGSAEPAVDAREARVLLGVSLVQCGHSLQQAADLSHAPKETIRRRCSGTPARQYQHTTGPQRLLDHEEAALVCFIIEMEQMGFPLRRMDVERSALTLILARWEGTDPPPPLGTKWFPRFIERHDPLKFKRKETLSRERTKGLSMQSAERFFSLLRELLTTHQLQPQQIWSMDETGVQRGTASTSFKYAVSSSPARDTATALQDGSQELTTAIEAISAAGTALPPCLIFKGKQADLSLPYEATRPMYMTASETGWTNAQISQQWFEKVFLPNTSSADEPKPHRLLIMDGHSSHFTLPLLKVAKEHNVHILGLPSHSTHGLAPLDRTCFAPLKLAWAEEQRWEMMLTGIVRREDVVRLYEAARAKGLTEANILSGYAATGIWPLKGTEALPQAMFSQPNLTSEQLQEAERDVLLSNVLADQLERLARSQRSIRASQTVLAASARLRQSEAVRTLMDALIGQMRAHASALKSKPATFRVAEPGFGQARIYTADECIALMEEAEHLKQAEQEERQRRAEERAAKAAQKKLDDEAKVVRRRALEGSRKQKKAQQAAEKAEKAAIRERAKQDRLRREEEKRRQREADQLNKPAKRVRKDATNSAESGDSNSTSAPLNHTNRHVLQPTQPLNE